MKRHIVVPLVTALLLHASPSHTQHRTPTTAMLPAFTSERALAAYLRHLDRGAERTAQPGSMAPAACPGGGTGTASGSAKGAAVIRGRVSAADGTMLRDATVFLCGTTQRVVTGADGGFRVVIPGNRVPAGHRVSLLASRIAYQTAVREITVAPGDSSSVQFTLATSAVNLSSVVVSAAGVAVSNNESVTNTQTAGVDEGGIVKVHGDHLVMLRRGRLFTVAIGDRRLTPVSAIDAFAPGSDGRGAWYDEMLVYGDRVVVIGYSYAGGGTEVGLFDIDRAGRLRHNSTYHLRSDDYYSSRNYASRLAGGKLIFYTPLSVDAGDTTAGWLPSLRRWHAGAGDDEFRPIISPTRIYRPVRALGGYGELTLHTVTTCDLVRPRMTCHAMGVLGPSGEVFYVSATAVYVWVTDGWRRRNEGAGESMVYRLPLDGSAPSALGVTGSPVDQFSFLEGEDGYLNVLVRTGARGHRMWSAEHAGGGVALLRVALRRFGDGGAGAPRSAYRALPSEIEGYAFANRFVGHHLLYGGGSGWGRPDRSGRWTLHTVPISGGPVAELTLPHGVDRIEVMGREAVVVGTDGRDLHFTGIALTGRPRVVQRYVSRASSQGELRSHGFFYKPDETGGGILGLPIRGPARPGYEHLFDESASVLFLRNHASSFRPLGELEAHPEGPDADDTDGCVASCVDWYGNSRPLFLRGRVFAMLGYEIVEGRVTDGRIREVRRVSYAPCRSQVSRR